MNGGAKSRWLGAAVGLGLAVATAYFLWPEHAVKRARTESEPAVERLPPVERAAAAADLSPPSGSSPTTAFRAVPPTQGMAAPSAEPTAEVAPAPMPSGSSSQTGRKQIRSFEPPPVESRRVEVERSFRESSPTSPLSLQHQSREAQATRLNARLGNALERIRSRVESMPAGPERDRLAAELSTIEKNYRLRQSLVARGEKDRELFASRPSAAK